MKAVIFSIALFLTFISCKQEKLKEIQLSDIVSIEITNKGYNEQIKLKNRNIITDKDIIQEVIDILSNSKPIDNVIVGENYGYIQSVFTNSKNDKIVVKNCYSVYYGASARL